MKLQTLTRIADLCLEARKDVHPATDRTLGVLLDMTLLEVGRRIASHPDFEPERDATPEAEAGGLLM